MRDIKIKVGGMSQTKTGAANYYSLLGLPDKDRAIKG